MLVPQFVPHPCRATRVPAVARPCGGSHADRGGRRLRGNSRCSAFPIRSHAPPCVDAVVPFARQRECRRSRRFVDFSTGRLDASRPATEGTRHVARCLQGFFSVGSPGARAAPACGSRSASPSWRFHKARGGPAATRRAPRSSRRYDGVAMRSRPAPDVPAAREGPVAPLACFLRLPHWTGFAHRCPVRLGVRPRPRA